MRKTDKKRDNAIRQALTWSCEQALDNHIEGFLWLTHTVDYQNFPDSLTVVCVFRADKHLQDSQALAQLRVWVVEALKDIGVPLPRPERQIHWDSEEACERQHSGNWSHRLARH